jgi:hypothetical protein
LVTTLRHEVLTMQTERDAALAEVFQTQQTLGRYREISADSPSGSGVRSRTPGRHHTLSPEFRRNVRSRTMADDPGTQSLGDD